MKIELTPEQYRELIETVVIGSIVRENVLMQNEDDEAESVNDLQKYLLSYAKESGAPELAEEDEDGDLVPGEDVMDEATDLLIDHDEIVFWSQLARKMALRDFERTATPAQLQMMEETGVPAEDLLRLLDRYAQEIDENELDRFRVDF